MYTNGRQYFSYLIILFILTKFYRYILLLITFFLDIFQHNYINILPIQICIIKLLIWSHNHTKV